VRQAHTNERYARDRFDAQAARLADQLRARLQTYEYGLRGARGAIQAAGEHTVSRDSFRTYHLSRDLDREFRGAHGFGFVRRVPPQAVAAFVAAARRDGAPDFQVRQLAPHEGERWVIQYIEPIERNRDAVGLDIASEPLRRHAAEQAMLSGAATLTAPITLVQASGLAQRSFLLLLPIYRSAGAVPDTPEARRAALYGWSYAPLVIDEVLKDFALHSEAFALALHDAVDGGPPLRFFASDDFDDAALSRNGALRHGLALPLFGRHCNLELRARPRFYGELNLLTPGEVGAAGVLASGQIGRAHV
jgi:CHASE1-domain containing sensor protein